MSFPRSRLLLREARKGEIAVGLLAAIDKGLKIPDAELPEKLLKSDKVNVNSALADLLQSPFKVML